MYEPFGRAIKGQCEKVFLQYAIDRPGVLVAVPGVQTMEHLDTLLKFLNASEEEKDYSIIVSHVRQVLISVLSINIMTWPWQATSWLPIIIQSYR